MKRRCGRCLSLKPVSEFAWRRKHHGQLDSMCRGCRAAYHRQHYLANGQRYIARARKQALALERTSYRIHYFNSHPCADCGESDPVVLEFDHLDTQAKSFDIGQSLPYRKWESILEEIEKCEVVCANCHRRRTARRRGSLRALLNESSECRGLEAGGGNRTRLRELGRLLCSRYTTPACDPRS
jgi:hypothetical protein